MKLRRAEIQMTYDELAERTGMSRRSVIDYEQGRSNGTLLHWYRIAAALGVEFSDLMSALD